MLNIGVDIDGVLGAFVPAARKLCQEMFDGRPDDSLVQRSWSFETLGITPEEEKVLWRRIDSTPNWWLTHDVLPETSLLKSLCDRHRVTFITNRKDGLGLPVDKQSAEWLQRKFGIFYPTVLLSNDKGPLVAGLKLHYFIDDRPKNIEEVYAYYPECKTVLLDTTYNQDCKYPVRVKSFNEFAKPLLEDVIQKRVYDSNWSR